MPVRLELQDCKSVRPLKCWCKQYCHLYAKGRKNSDKMNCTSNMWDGISLMTLLQAQLNLPACWHSGMYQVWSTAIG